MRLSSFPFVIRRIIVIIIGDIQIVSKYMYCYLFRNMYKI